METLSIGVVKLYSDGMVHSVTFASTDEFTEVN